MTIHSSLEVRISSTLFRKLLSKQFEFSDAHTSSLMMSDSDSEDEEIIFDDDLNRKPIMNGNLNKRNGIPKAQHNARA